MCWVFKVLDDNWRENKVKTRSVPRSFFILAKWFWNGSKFGFRADDRGAAMRRTEVNTELIRNWLYPYGVLALYLLN